MYMDVYTFMIIHGMFYGYSQYVYSFQIIASIYIEYTPCTFYVYTSNSYTYDVHRCIQIDRYALLTPLRVARRFFEGAYPNLLQFLTQSPHFYKFITNPLQLFLSPLTPLHLLFTISYIISAFSTNSLQFFLSPLTPLPLLFPNLPDTHTRLSNIPLSPFLLIAILLLPLVPSSSLHYNSSSLPLLSYLYPNPISYPPLFPLLARILSERRPLLSERSTSVEKISDSARDRTRDLSHNNPTRSLLCHARALLILLYIIY